jgi:hypothetical protein
MLQIINTLNYEYNVYSEYVYMHLAVKLD